MGSVVSLVRTQPSQETPKDAVSKALALINYQAKGSIKRVAIKANLCYYWKAATGYTTDPQLVAAIIDQLREMYSDRIDITVVEADATAMKTKYAFPILEYDKMVTEKNVELFNLSQDDLEDRTVLVNDRQLTFKVPNLLLSADLFVNVPKLKVMREVGITCALKNIFGCIGFPRKIVYHPFLSEAIVGINKILHPHLTIVDGLIALGRFPTRLGLIMASVDPFSIDWVASEIAGYDPSRIKFLKIAQKEKLIRPKDIVTLGENIETFKRIFPKEKSSSRFLWNAQLRLLKWYTKLANDVVPDMLEGI